MNDLTITPKHRNFVREYLLSYDAEDAAEKAGYARRSGVNLLRKPAIRTLLRRRQSVLDAESNIDQKKVLDKLAKMAFFDPRDVMGWETNAYGGTEVWVKDSDDLSPEVASMIKEISVDKDGNAKVKLHDSAAALDKIARHLGMYNDTVGVDFTGELADLLKGAVNNGHNLPTPVGGPGVGETTNGPGVSRGALPTPVAEDGELIEGSVLEVEQPLHDQE